MKNLSFLTCFTFLVELLAGQSFGVRTTAIFSGSDVHTRSFGYGLHVNIVLAGKLEAIMFGDYTFKNDELIKSDWSYVDNKRHAVGAGILYNFVLGDRIDFKIGPDLSYNWINALRRGADTGWWQYLDADYLEFGIINNIRWREAFKLPVNFEFFITPNFLRKVRNGEYSRANESFRQLHMQFGISYQLGKD